MNALTEEINPGKLYAHGLWTKHEIKMVEYWQNSFWCVYGQRPRKEE